MEEDNTVKNKNVITLDGNRGGDSFWQWETMNNNGPRVWFAWDKIVYESVFLQYVEEKLLVK